MKATWKKTAVLTLILIGIMQVLPFIPAHNNCQAACCVETVSCCEAEASTGCDMAMTSCSVSLFVPLISAPLLKVESNVQLDICLAPASHEQILKFQARADDSDIGIVLEAPPPDKTPLLI